MISRLLTAISSIAAAGLLLSCNQVPIHDEIFYGNKGMMGAVEFHTLTTDTREIGFEDWMGMIRTQPLVCSSVSTFADMKAAFEKLCSVCNCCNADTKAKAEEFFNQVMKVEKK